MTYKAQVVTAIIAAVGGAAIGTGVTYIVVKKRVEARANKDIADVKEHYKLLRKADGTLGILGEHLAPAETRSGEDTYRAAKDIVDNYELIEGLQYGASSEESVTILSRPSSQVLEERQNEGEPEPEDERDIPYGASGNLFDGDFVYEVIEGEPRLISRQEFEDADSSWDRESLTYYAGDDTLYEVLTAGTIDKIEETIGRRHLEMFGRWSDDPEVVYIENKNIGTMYEVGHHDGHYSVSILGLDPEELGIKEPKARPLRMRDHDE